MSYDHQGAVRFCTARLRKDELCCLIILKTSLGDPITRGHLWTCDPSITWLLIPPQIYQLMAKNNQAAYFYTGPQLFLSSCFDFKFKIYRAVHISKLATEFQLSWVGMSGRNGTMGGRGGGREGRGSSDSFRWWWQSILSALTTIKNSCRSSLFFSLNDVELSENIWTAGSLKREAWIRNQNKDGTGCSDMITHYMTNSRKADDTKEKKSSSLPVLKLCRLCNCAR